VGATGQARFGDLLKGYREHARLSQEDLASRAGLSRRGISDLERGARLVPQRETTRRLIAALDLTAAQQATLLAAAREGRFEEPPSVAPAPRLPLPLTSFIGRERELRELSSALRTSRLLTLTGIGGIGKTRLALELARRMATEFADGVAVVDLSSLADEGLVTQAVGAALGVRERPGQPIATRLEEALSERELLLVLDNCEHVLDASAALTDQLLRTCPDLRILATSREPLRVGGETRWMLTPLPLPLENPDSEPSEAVLLFRDRARAQDASFRLNDANLTAIAEVCRRLDGLPLAIELAATWVPVLPPDEIARRLDDRLPLLTGGSRAAQPRQQALRASLDWSYDLLSEPDRVVFRRLAVFAGGWTLEAAEAVCGDSGSAPQTVLASLARLADKSMVQIETVGSGVRYRFLETVRQYGLEKLRASDESAQLSGQHAAFFVDLAARATSELAGPPSPDKHVQLEAEHDNLRATVRWVIGRGDADAAYLLGAALARFSQIGNHLAEGRAWLAEILTLSDEPTLGRARVLIGAGLLAAYQGDYEFATESLLDGVRICRVLGEDRELAHGLFALGLIAWTRGDAQAARRYGQEGLLVSRRAEHRGFEALHLFIGAAAAVESGDRAMARTLAEQSRTLASHARFGRAIGLSLGVLGTVSYLEADYRQASSLLEQAIEQLHTAGIPVAVAWVTSLLGRVASAQGNYAEARERSGDALRLVRSFNLKGRAPFVLEGLAEALAHDGDAEGAVLLASAAQAIRRRLGASTSEAEQARLDEWLARARAELDSGADAAWAAGQAMALDEAIESALGLAGAVTAR
jgi:non-specific serine/threonine protein kinase